jgi:hypothetical protein
MSFGGQPFVGALLVGSASHMRFSIVESVVVFCFAFSPKPSPFLHKNGQLGPVFFHLLVRVLIRILPTILQGAAAYGM